MAQSDSSNTDGSAVWLSFVEVLSTCPDMIDRLMATHLPDDTGLCRACTVPGRGSPYRRWPCALWTLADSARRVRALRRIRG